MSHFARVIDGVVEKTIVAEQDYINLLPDAENWIECSYNTRKGVHTDGKTPLRGNFPGPGYIYDKEYDVFYPQKPFPTAVLNKKTWDWDGISITVFE